MPGPRRRKRMRSNRNFRKAVQAIVEKNIETKWINSATQTTVSNTAIAFDLNAIAQGDSASQRSGNLCRMTGLYGNIALNIGSPTAEPTLVRMIMYSPRTPDDGPVVTSTLGIIDFQRFTVFEDKYFILAPGGPAAKVFRVKRSFTRGSKAGILAKFNAPGLGSIQQGQIILAFVSDNAADPAGLEINIRAYFKDA